MVGGVPIELDDLIMRMLDRDPSRRPGSLDEVVVALAGCGVWTGSWPVDREITVPMRPLEDIEQPATVAE
jgi:hypothetical protein